MTDAPVAPVVTSVAAKVANVATGKAPQSFVKTVIADVSKLEAEIVKLWPAHKVAMVGIVCFFGGNILALIFGW